MAVDAESKVYLQTRAAGLKAMRSSMDAHDTAVKNGLMLEAKLHGVAVMLQWMALGIDPHDYNPDGILQSVYRLHKRDLLRAFSDAQGYARAHWPKPAAVAPAPENLHG